MNNVERKQNQSEINDQRFIIGTTDVFLFRVGENLCEASLLRCL
jgi:hypothetical protein